MLDQIRKLVRSARENTERKSVLRQAPALESALKIKTHMRPSELLQLYKLAQGKESAVEIGSYLGASACAISAGLQLTGKPAQICCIDTWNNDAMSDGTIDTFAAFSQNTAAFADKIVPVRGWSTKVVETVSKHTPKVDLLFIDGDHSFEGARDDWLAYKNFLAPGAWVVMHDVSWAEGVQKVITDMIEPATHEAGRLPNLWWGKVV